jgi:hypothetical protein
MQGALSQVPAGLSQQEVQQAVNRELNNDMQDVANRVNQQRHVGRQGHPDSLSWQASQDRVSQDRVQTDFVVEELPDDAVATRSPRARQQGSGLQKQLPPAEMSGHAAAAGPLTTTQRTLSSAPTAGAPESNQSSTTTHVPSISQRPTAPARVHTQITAPCARPGPIPPNIAVDHAFVTSRNQNSAVDVASQRPRLRALEASPAGVSEDSLARVERSVSSAASHVTAPYATQGSVRLAAVDNALVTSRTPNPVMNVIPQGSRFRALEASPASPSIPENALVRVERSVPRPTLPSSDVSPQALRRTEAPAAQRQILDPLTAGRPEILQQPSRRFQQIEPPAT